LLVSGYFFPGALAQEPLEVVIIADSPEPSRGPLIVAPAVLDVPIGIKPKFLFKAIIDRFRRSELGPGEHDLYFYWRPVGDMTSLNPLDVKSSLTITGRKLPINRLQGFNSNCRFYNDGKWSRFIGPLGDCDAKGAWNIRGTTEDKRFLPAGYFLPDDYLVKKSRESDSSRDYWDYEFIKNFGGDFSVRWNIDKSRSDRDVDNYSGGFISLVGFGDDSRLSSPLFVDVVLSIVAVKQLDDSVAGHAKIRTTLGVLTHWSSSLGDKQTAFVEVNLFRSNNFDLCLDKNIGDMKPDGFCDPLGVYDRRNFFNGGEIVYYDINSMHKISGPVFSTLKVGGGGKSFTIPLSMLFQRYSWVKPPLRWDDARVEGIYIGHEIWGRGAISAIFEKMYVYQFLAD